MSSIQLLLKSIDHLSSRKVIHLHHKLILGKIAIKGQLRDDNASIVDEHVDFGEGRLNVFDGVCNWFVVRKVSLSEERDTIQFFKLFPYWVKEIVSSINNENGRLIFPCELKGHLPSDSHASSSDDDQTFLIDVQLFAGPESVDEVRNNYSTDNEGGKLRQIAVSCWEDIHSLLRYVIVVYKTIFYQNGNKKRTSNMIEILTALTS